MAIFWDNLGKPVPACHQSGFCWSSDDGGGGETGDKALQSSSQIVTTNKLAPSFLNTNTKANILFKPKSKPAFLNTAVLLFATVSLKFNFFHCILVVLLYCILLSCNGNAERYSDAIQRMENTATIAFTK